MFAEGSIVIEVTPGLSAEQASYLDRTLPIMLSDAGPAQFMLFEKLNAGPKCLTHIQLAIITSPVRV